MSQCHFLHICSFCDEDHSHCGCPHNPTPQTLGKYLSMPINIPALAAALRNHLDPAFIQFIINGFKEGSHGGISTQSSISLKCKKYFRLYHRSFTFLSFDQVTMTCLIAYTQSMMATKAHAIKIYCSGIRLFSTFLMLLEL